MKGLLIVVETIIGRATSSTNFLRLIKIDLLLLLKAIVLRDRVALEEEYDKIYQELMTPVKIGYEDDKATDGTMASAPPIGIETQLVDSDGLQRTDIDLVRAHMLRQRYQVLKSDIEALRGQTEELLEKIALAQVMSLSSDTNYRVVSVS